MTENNSGSLSEKFKQKAIEELREDDLRKQQALAQFREWILKQGHIKNCRTDDSFLLRFLRVKKYNNSAAFKMLENFLVRSQQFSHWLKDLNFNNGSIKELYELGYAIPLKERDKNGCRVILFRSNVIDTKKHTYDDINRILLYIILTLSEEEETQIAGFKYIFDHKGIQSDFVSLFSFTDLKNFMVHVQGAIPARQKQGMVTNLPSFFVAILEFIKSILPKKLKDRIYIYNDDSKLVDHFDKSILPSEYGGQVPIEEMLKDFKKIAEKYESKLKATDDITIDIEYVKKCDDQEVGSFRKLEID